MNKILQNNLPLLCLVLIYCLAVLPLSFELPSINEISNSLSLTTEDMKLSITLFWTMFTVGQFIFALLLPRLSMTQSVSVVIGIFIICFFTNGLISTGYTFFTIRVFEGLSCGGLLLLGRFSLAKIYGDNEENYLTQFAKVSSMVTALTAIAPVIGGYIGEYAHWRIIYLLLGVSGIFAFWLRPFAFQFNAPKVSNMKNDIMLVVADISLAFNSILGGFSRSIIVNFNTNLALFLFYHKHWSSYNYGMLMFCFCSASILARLFLVRLRKEFGVVKLNFILMFVIIVGSICLLVEPIIHQDIVFFFAGSIITMAASLLTTLYSSRAQFCLAKQSQAMSLAVMGVLQNIALVLGSLMSVFIATNSIIPIIEIVIFSTILLFIMDFFINVYHRPLQSVS